LKKVRREGKKKSKNTHNIRISYSKEEEVSSAADESDIGITRYVSLCKRV